MGGAVKTCPQKQPQQELRTRRGVAANKRVTPTKTGNTRAEEGDLGRGGMEEWRRGDGMSLSL